MDNLHKSKKIKYQIRKCITCGKEFTNRCLRVKNCSRKCGKIQGALKIYKQVKRICVVCRKEFTIPPAWLRKEGNNGSYCSQKCRFSKPSPYTSNQKQAATHKIMREIKMERLVKKPCEICGNKISKAHHYKGYKKENWLKIIWLCHKHHMLEHERLRKFGLSEYL